MTGQYDPAYPGMDHRTHGRYRTGRWPDGTMSGACARSVLAQLPGLYDVEDPRCIELFAAEDIRIIRVEPGNDSTPERGIRERNMNIEIDRRETFHVFSRKYCYHYPVKLDIEAMRDAADYLVGTKDFTSFTDNRETRDTIRRIYSIKVVRAGDKVRITYYGSGFMYHMARILTGTLIEVGAGKREASNLPLVLEAKDRSMAGFLAPARGLFLRKVYY